MCIKPYSMIVFGIPLVMSIFTIRQPFVIFCKPSFQLRLVCIGPGFTSINQVDKTYYVHKSARIQYARTSSIIDTFYCLCKFHIRVHLGCGIQEENIYQFGNFLCINFVMGKVIGQAQILYSFCGIVYSLMITVVIYFWILLSVFSDVRTRRITRIRPIVWCQTHVIVFVTTGWNLLFVCNRCCFFGEVLVGIFY